MRSRWVPIGMLLSGATNIYSYSCPQETTAYEALAPDIFEKIYTSSAYLGPQYSTISKKELLDNYRARYGWTEWVYVAMVTGVALRDSASPGSPGMITEVDSIRIIRVIKGEVPEAAKSLAFAHTSPNVMGDPGYTLGPLLNKRFLVFTPYPPPTDTFSFHNLLSQPCIRAEADTISVSDGWIHPAGYEPFSMPLDDFLGSIGGTSSARKGTAHGREEARLRSRILGGMIPEVGRDVQGRLLPRDGSHP